jgi:plastocyanin
MSTETTFKREVVVLGRGFDRAIYLFLAAAIPLLVLAGVHTLLPLVQPTRPVAPLGTVVLEMKDMAYSSAEIVVVGSTVNVSLSNLDFLPHTFTIDEVGMDQEVPALGKAQLTFTAEPGVYSIYCAIPGHREAGMVGTLTVTP